MLSMGVGDSARTNVVYGSWGFSRDKCCLYIWELGIQHGQMLSMGVGDSARTNVVYGSWGFSTDKCCLWELGIQHGQMLSMGVGDSARTNTVWLDSIAVTSLRPSSVFP